MNFPKTSRVTTLLGTASLLAIAQAEGVYAAEVVAQAEEIPETVLITGSLIRGTDRGRRAGDQSVAARFCHDGRAHRLGPVPHHPAVQRQSRPGGDRRAPTTSAALRVNLRQLDTGIAHPLADDDRRHALSAARQRALPRSIPRSFPPSRSNASTCSLDGASATYGSDAIGGVINIILKRNFDGAMIEAGWTTAEGGNNQYLASGMWGRTWDGGQVTLSYSWYRHLAHARETSTRSSPLTTGPGASTTDARSAPRLLARSPPAPGRLSMPDPNNPGSQIPNPHYPGNLGTNCQNCYAIPLGTGFDWDAGASRHRSAAARQRADSGLGELQRPGQSRHQRHAERLQPVRHRLITARAIQYTGGAITVDQRLTSNISFYGSGFYSMRRSQHRHQRHRPSASPIGGSDLQPLLPDERADRICASPITWVSRSPRIERSLCAGSALSARPEHRAARGLGDAGLFLAHQGQDTSTEDPAERREQGRGVRGSGLDDPGDCLPAGTTPAIATWTKPANVPYLNLFCDPPAYQCNSPDHAELPPGHRRGSASTCMSRSAASKPTARCSICRAAR